MASAGTAFLGALLRNPGLAGLASGIGIGSLQTQPAHLRYPQPVMRDAYVLRDREAVGRMVFALEVG